MRAQHFSILFVFFACLAASAPAAAEECPLKMALTIDTESDSSGAMLLPVNFGATRKLLLVDTGGVFHHLRPGVAKELGLTTRESHQVQIIDATRGTTSTVARAHPFSIGKMNWDAMDFVVSPENGLMGDETVSGVFAPGTLHAAYDVDLDFPGRKFSLLSADHCPGAVVYWPHTAVAVVPVHFDATYHILIPVQVDGYDLQAMVNTGASDTIMFTRIARRLGVDAEAGGATEVGNLGNNPNARVYQHRFHTLSIEGITVNNPTITLIPDLTRTMTERGPAMDSHFAAQADQDREDMMVGMSILRRLHVYIAYQERKLYITAGGAPPPAQPAASGSAAPTK